MSLATINLDGGMGNVVLGLYALGGVLLAASALLPGTKTWVRVLKVVIGLGLAAWSAWVWLFGGFIIVNLYVAILPFLLAFQGVMAMVKSRREGEHAAQQQAVSPQGWTPAGPGSAETPAQGATETPAQGAPAAHR
jgi:hypothetical protein